MKLGFKVLIINIVAWASLGQAVEKCWWQNLAAQAKTTYDESVETVAAKMKKVVDGNPSGKTDGNGGKTLAERLQSAVGAVTSLPVVEQASEAIHSSGILSQGGAIAGKVVEGAKDTWRKSVGDAPKLDGKNIEQMATISASALWRVGKWATALKTTPTTSEIQVKILEEVVKVGGELTPEQLALVATHLSASGEAVSWVQQQIPGGEVPPPVQMVSGLLATVASTAKATATGIDLTAKVRTLMDRFRLPGNQPNSEE